MTSSPKMCREGHRCEPVTLREAWHCQINHSEMRIDELARRCGMQPRVLQNFANAYGEQMVPPKHHELLLELTKDNLAVVTYLADVQESHVFRVQQRTVLASTAEMMRDFSAFLSTLSEANSDGVITPAEAIELKRRGGEAMSAMAALVSDAETRSLPKVPGPRLASAR